MTSPPDTRANSPEEQARIILESVTDAFFLLDREFRFAYLNGTARRLLQRDDLVGKHIWTEFPAACGTQFQQAYERAMHAGVRVDFVEHYPAPLDRWYEVRAYPSPEGVSVYFQDITERRETEAAYRRSREQLELVMRGADVGVWYCPLPFDELIWDDKVKEHFHLPPDARVTIETFYERLHPDDRERTRAAIAQSVAERTHYDIDYRTVSPDGRHTKWIRAIGRAFYDADGRPERFDGVTVDTSDRKLAELAELAVREREERYRERALEAERAARAEAERQSRMKDEFLATLSHELRTPLNAILGWTQIAETRARTGADVAGALEVIARNALAQARIVGDLLDMSAMLAGKIQLEVHRLSLGPLVAAAAETARPTAEAKGVRLEVHIAEVPEIEVLGDAGRLQQVLWNLLSNAIKFTPTGGTVQIGLASDAERVTVTVRDDGEGIAPEFLPFVFERFRQADGSTTRRHGGLGLGLSLVKQVVELHGGTVRGASAGLGHGSAFTVELPRARDGA